MNYTREAILKLSDVVKSNSPEGIKWLSLHKHRELLLFKEAVLFNKDAEDWLIQNKHFVLAAFVGAVHGDEKAFQFLMKHKFVQWAAAVNAANGDKAAMKWLEKNGFSHFETLSRNFFERFKEHAERNTAAFYKGPFSD